MKPGQGIMGRNELSVMGGGGGVAEAIGVSRLEAGQGMPPQPWVLCREAWVGQRSASSLSHTSRLRQTVESKQGQLSRTAVRDALWAVEPAVPNPVRQARPREKGTT